MIFFYFRFEPDFSISMVERTLRIHTSDDGIREFNLIAMLPHHLLRSCASLRTTPMWINWTSKLIWLVMIAILCFTVGLAVSKSNHVSNQILLRIFNEKMKDGVTSYQPNTEVFDLKALINTKELFSEVENPLSE